MNPIRLSRASSVIRPILREGSALRSSRDASDTSRLWIEVEWLRKQVVAQADQLRRFQEEFNRLRLRKGGDMTATASPQTCPFA
jgi:hypothetical protein